MKIRKGHSPDYERTLAIEYLSDEPRIVFQAKADGIAGEPQTVRMMIHNPRRSPFSGDLVLRTGRLQTAGPLSVSLQPQSSRVVEVSLEMPADAPDGLPIELIATLREHDSGSEWTWHSELTVHPPFTYTLSPVVTFPLREDQSFPLVHPALVSMKLPGEAVVHLRLRNWRSSPQTIKIGISGDGLRFHPGTSEVKLPPGGEQTSDIHALPTQGSRLYQISIRLSSGSFEQVIQYRWLQLSPASLSPMLSTTIAMASRTLFWRIRTSAVSSVRTRVEDHSRWS